uniref:Amino acid permease n=1 Tax=Peronospora matthiolae TaxID=2874970 RepID=A0AAV1UGG4_9STRA
MCSYVSASAVAVYIIPFIAIAGADMPHYTTWDDGSYSIIAQTIGGTWLCVWVLISSVIGNLGLFLAEMAKEVPTCWDGGLGPGTAVLCSTPP